jgi:hypothetical protein
MKNTNTKIFIEKADEDMTFCNVCPANEKGGRGCMYDYWKANSVLSR